MGIDSRWNTGASIPISSLTSEELKEAIHEWAEGCEELEHLLWTCYNNGLETSESHVAKHNNYFSFYISENSVEQAKRLLSATEAFGFGEIFVMFGGNPTSGANWHKTSFTVECLRPENVGEYFVNLANAVEDSEYAKTRRCFEFVADFARFFEDKMLGLDIRAKVRNYSEYELYIESYRNQRNWEYLDEFFGSLGMICGTSEELPLATWYIKASSHAEFYEAMKVLAEGIRQKWTLEIPTELTEDMPFNLQALIMQKKFGTSPEGVKRMNEWINSNNPNPKARKVNY